MKLDDIKARCRIVDGHWLWDGAMSDGWPRVFAPDFTLHGGKKASQNGRRAVWHVTKKKPIPKGWRVFGTCEERTCLNPKHMVCQPTAKWGEQLRETGKWLASVNRIVQSRAYWRRRGALTPELIELIHTSPKSAVRLAAETGLSRGAISKVRRGKVTAFTPVGGLVTGLLAANDSQRRRSA